MIEGKLYNSNDFSFNILDNYYESPYAGPTNTIGILSENSIFSVIEVIDRITKNGEMGYAIKILVAGSGVIGWIFPRKISNFTLMTEEQ
jgi:hypothetical protein